MNLISQINFAVNGSLVRALDGYSPNGTLTASDIDTANSSEILDEPI